MQRPQIPSRSDLRRRRLGRLIPNIGLGLSRLVRGLALMLPMLVMSAAAAAEPKHVLIIHSFGRDFGPNNAIVLTLRTDLAKLLRQPLAFREFSLDSERGLTLENERGLTLGNERPLIDFILSSGEPPDLIIANGAPAARFYVRHREALYQDRPLLVTGIDRRGMRGRDPRRERSPGRPERRRCRRCPDHPRVAAGHDHGRDRAWRLGARAVLGEGHRARARPGG